MNLFEKIKDLIPFGRQQEVTEYFFALNIGLENLKVCLWAVSRDKLKILNIASQKYSSNDEIVEITDKLLDQSLGELLNEPTKLLFGVPDSWLMDDNLKDPYLQLLRSIVKSLELSPMAYVSSSHAISHFLEKTDGAPSTAIIVGIGEENVSVTVVRGGKIDGTKISKRSNMLGEDIEKLLLGFGEVEVLPAKMLLFSLNKESLDKQKTSLLSYPWMSRLSFLHLPKIEILEEDIEIKSVALAGAVELYPDVKYEAEVPVVKAVPMVSKLPVEEKTVQPKEVKEDIGFVTGDVMENPPSKEATGDREEEEVSQTEEIEDKPGAENNVENAVESQEEEEYATFDKDKEVALRTDSPPLVQEVEKEISRGFKFLGIPRFGGKLKFIVPILILLLLAAGYIFLPKATVTIFVEPKVLERDTQVTADPKIKEVDEETKRIPGQIIETQASGSEKGSATGKKQIGESAKGTITITNKTNSPKTFSKGTTLSTGDNIKFSLESSVTVASQSATEDGISFGKASADANAVEIGADGNIPSGAQLTISGVSSAEFSAKSEGNFSGGTSKDVTVVSDADQKKLLASLASNLRKQAQEKLQAKLEGKKILEEALSEEITKRTFSKNINDQASEFTLNLTINYKGTAYLEDDLKRIVSNLVETNVPEDFTLSLADTETQADVSKVEKDGRLIFLARFRAKLMPKIDEEKIRLQIKGKTPAQAAQILKSFENVLSSEIKITPSLPVQFARLPLFERNIKLEVSLK